MIRLNPFAISSLLILITYLPVTLLLLVKGRTKASKIYAFKLTSVALWGLSGFLIAICTNPEIASELWKYAYVAVVFIPVLTQHTVLIITDYNNRTYLTFCYLQAIYFSLASLSGHLFPSVKLHMNSFYFHNDGFLYLLSFVFWIIIACTAHYRLYKYYIISNFNKKTHYFFLFILGIGFIGGIHNFLPSYFETYPYGNFIIIFLPFILTYSILKHQLFEISLTIKKGILYSILIGLISTLYLLLVLLTEFILQGYVQYQSKWISVSYAFIIGLAILPLRNKLQYWLDNYMFKGTPEEMAEQNILLRKELIEKEKLKIVANMASGIAHEVRNPLTSLKTFLQYLPEKKNNEQFIQMFSRLGTQELSRIHHLINNLLDFAKPSPPELKSTDIHQLIDDILYLLEAELRQKRIVIQRNFESSKVILNLDANQIKQAVLNILRNSIEAMPKGGTITISTATKNNHFTLEIQDTGPGIPKEQLKHLFEPFHTSKTEGTGLGLSITKSIIEGHEGKISISNQIHQGTLLQIHLKVQTKNAI